MNGLMLAAGLAAATLLAGCTGSATDAGSSSAPPPTPVSSSATPTPTPSATPTPTPTPTPTGPVELTIEEAGERYLTYVCVSNAANDKYFDTQDKYDAYASDSDSPHPKTRKAAQRGAEAYSTTAQALADPEYVWPESVQKDVAAVANYVYEQSAWFSSIAEADTWSDVSTLRGSGKMARAATSLRLTLGLPPREQCPKEYRP